MTQAILQTRAGIDRAQGGQAWMKRPACQRFAEMNRRLCC
jgi:hypothetical protein